MRYMKLAVNIVEICNKRRFLDTFLWFFLYNIGKSYAEEYQGIWRESYTI